MKISTRGRYGIKAMVDLAEHCQNGKCVPLKSIAKRQNIPESYLEQLMAIIKKAEIIHSVRGAQGGYVLSKELDEISVGDLLKVLEGNLALTDCVEENNPKKICANGDCEKCNMKDTWDLISKKFEDVVNNITLKDLVQS